MQLRRTAFVKQKKKEEKIIEPEEKKTELPTASVQSLLSSKNSTPKDEDRAEIDNVIEKISQNEDTSSTQNTIKDEFNSLNLSIKRLDNDIARLKDLLVRAKLLTIEPSSNSVEAIRFEYLSARLTRLRQLAVTMATSDRGKEAKDSYILWSTNQRNLAIRKATLDIDEMQKKKKSVVEKVTDSPPASVTPKKVKGLSNLFGSDEFGAAGRHIKFTTLDTTDSIERRPSILSAIEGPVLPDPLATGSLTLDDVMDAKVDTMIERHRSYLDSLCENDVFFAETTPKEPPRRSSLTIGRPDKALHMLKALKAEDVQHESGRPIGGVSFCEGTEPESNDKEVQSQGNFFWYKCNCNY